MKRFTDTELSDKEWFMSLSCRLKCAVRYLFDKCDNAGVWTPNYKLAAIYVGEPFNECEILEIDGGEQFEKFGEKILVKGFVDFQYGELSENCNAHKPIIKKLLKYGLWDEVEKSLIKENLRVPKRVPDTLKEKDKDKEQEKEFGKSENLLEEKFQNNLIPALLKIFLEKNTGYLYDQTKDAQALNQIAIYLGDKLGFKGQSIFYNKDEQHIIKLRWGEIVTFIHGESFFRNYSLTQISRHFQSILLKKYNGNKTPPPSPKSSKNAGRYELLDEIKQIAGIDT